MREHPIPQDIVGYRFHIVGNMTIKQFAEIGVGVFIAFLLYQTNLLSIIKWPLMAISVAVGAALAFVPFEERPLDHWLFTLVKVLYRPTKFYWKREAFVPESFAYKPSEHNNNEQLAVDLTPARRERIKEYMLSIRTVHADTFDAEYDRSISTIMTTFNDLNVSAHGTASLAKPRLKVRVRSLGDGLDDDTTSETTSSTPSDLEAPEWSTEIQKQLTNTIAVPSHTALDVTQVAQEIVVPEQQLISVEATPTISAQDEAQQAAAAAAATSTEQTSTPVFDAASLASDQPTILAGGAIFNQNLPFPTRPTEPNKLVGMVLTPQNELVNDAIVEIKSAAGDTLRAVKTNALGQFFVTTPLADGTYTIHTEKEDMSFSPVSVTLANAVIDPIEIHSIV